MINILVSLSHFEANIYLDSSQSTGIWNLGHSISLFLTLHYLSCINSDNSCQCYFPLSVVYRFVLSQGSQSLYWQCVTCFVKQTSCHKCMWIFSAHTQHIHFPLVIIPAFLCWLDNFCLKQALLVGWTSGDSPDLLCNSSLSNSPMLLQSHLHGK